MPPRRVIFSADGSIDREGSKAANNAVDSDEEEELKRARIAEIMGIAPPTVKTEPNSSTTTRITASAPAQTARCPCCQRPFNVQELANSDREIKLGRDHWCIRSAMRGPRPSSTSSTQQSKRENKDETNEESVFVPGQIANTCEKRLRHYLSQSIDDKHKVWPDSTIPTQTESTPEVALFVSTASR